MLCSPSTAIFTTLTCAASNPACSSARYCGSRETKCGLHISILLILNFSTTCGAKVCSVIFAGGGAADFAGLGVGGVDRSPDCVGVMNSRKGYDAMQMRSRVAVGKLMCGPESAANSSAGKNSAPAS